MSNIAIRVENLSKQYRIGGPQARYKTIRESLVEALALSLSKGCRPPSAVRRPQPGVREEEDTDKKEKICVHLCESVSLLKNCKLWTI